MRTFHRLCCICSLRVPNCDQSVHDSATWHWPICYTDIPDNHWRAYQNDWRCKKLSGLNCKHVAPLPETAACLSNPRPSVMICCHTKEPKAEQKVTLASDQILSVLLRRHCLQLHTGKCEVGVGSTHLRMLPNMAADFRMLCEADGVHT